MKAQLHFDAVDTVVESVSVVERKAAGDSGDTILVTRAALMATLKDSDVPSLPIGPAAMAVLTQARERQIEGKNTDKIRMLRSYEIETYTLIEPAEPAPATTKRRKVKDVETRRSHVFPCVRVVRTPEFSVAEGTPAVRWTVEMDIHTPGDLYALIELVGRDNIVLTTESAQGDLDFTAETDSDAETASMN